LPKGRHWVVVAGISLLSNQRCQGRNEWVHGNNRSIIPRNSQQPTKSTQVKVM